jgi:hypothetical protein
VIRPWEETVTASEAVATILLKENSILRIYVQMKLGGEGKERVLNWGPAGQLHIYHVSAFECYSRNLSSRR